MNHYHEFVYKIENDNIPDMIFPHEVRMKISGDVNIWDMLKSFEQYLKACGFDVVLEDKEIVLKDKKQDV